VDVGMLGHEVLQRLSSRVPRAGKDNGVGARCEGSGESITNTTVGTRNCRAR
jgi:hypothetical protein